MVRKPTVIIKPLAHRHVNHDPDALYAIDQANFVIVSV